jgi:hypothetical protein
LFEKFHSLVAQDEASQKCTFTPLYPYGLLIVESIKRTLRDHCNHSRHDSLTSTTDILKYSQKFGQALDEFSGGFIAHSIESYPDLDAEDDGYEVAYVKYQSTVPSG